MPFFIHLILLCFHVEKVLPFYLYFCFLVAEQPASGVYIQKTYTFMFLDNVCDTVVYLSDKIKLFAETLFW